MMKDGTLYCSFCGKSQHEVRKLIAGPNAFICNECVDLCNDIIADQPPKPRNWVGTLADIGVKEIATWKVKY